MESRVNFSGKGHQNIQPSTRPAGNRTGDRRPDWEAEILPQRQPSAISPEFHGIIDV